MTGDSDGEKRRPQTPRTNTDDSVALDPRRLSHPELRQTPDGAVHEYFPSSGEPSGTNTPDASKNLQPLQRTKAADRSANASENIKELRNRLKDQLSDADGVQRMDMATPAAEKGKGRAVDPSDLQRDEDTVPLPGRQTGPSAKYELPARSAGKPLRKAGSVTAGPQEVDTSRFVPRGHILPRPSTSARIAPTPRLNQAGSTLGTVPQGRGEGRGSIVRDYGLPDRKDLLGPGKRQPTNLPKLRSGQSQRPQPFSLAGGPSFRQRSRRPTFASSRPTGLAVPMPSHRKQPSWTQKNRRGALFSLGKPLPTKDEVDAQREWEEEIKRLKESNPDVQAPPPPMLPSELNPMADPDQLAGLIRMVIQEYQSVQNGDADSFPASYNGPRRGTRSSAPGMPREGSELSTLDSMVIEDEEGPPIEEEAPRHARKNYRKSPHAPQAIPDGKAEDAFRQKQAEEEEARKDGASADPSKLPAEPAPHDHADSPGEETAVNSPASSVGAEKGVRPEDLADDEEGHGENDEIDAEEDGGSFVEEEQEETEDFPNPIARYRSFIREPAAEFLGALVLSIIGIGSTIQAGVSANEAISPSGQGSSASAVYLSVPLAWGIGIAVAVYIAGGISGGHLSPVISIVLAVFRGFPWRKVPAYILAQIAGFTTGTAVVYALYRHAITIVENGSRTLGPNGTGSYFATYAQGYVSNAAAWFQEFVNVAIFVVLVLAIGDSANVPPPAGLNPIVLMFMGTAIGLSLGLQTGWSLNPARDLGARLVSWWCGYSTEVWSFRNQYWLWCVWLADISGGFFGAVLYDTLIFTGEESPLNWKWKWRDVNPVLWYRKARRGLQKTKLPSNISVPGKRKKQSDGDKKIDLAV